MFPKVTNFRHGILHVDANLRLAIPHVSVADRRVETNQLLSFWHQAWRRFEDNCPQAQTVLPLLKELGPLSVDHVALRTFNLPAINRDKVGSIFKRHGYLKVPELLKFPDKHLQADYYIHPDANQPKIFVSELCVEKVSPALQSFVWQTARHARVEKLDDFLNPNWSAVSLPQYEEALQESEYAAWVSAFGLQVNHFAFLTNDFGSHSNLPELNRLLLSKGFTLNAAGGLVKGSKSDLLEQSSTMAPLVCGRFKERWHPIPGCFVEFVQRHPIGTVEGLLYQGFRSGNANKIFESTSQSKFKTQ